MTKKFSLFQFAEPTSLNACISNSFESYSYFYRHSALLFLNLLMCANINEDLKHLLKTHLFKMDEEHPVLPDNDYIIPIIFMYGQVLFFAFVVTHKCRLTS